MRIALLFPFVVGVGACGAKADQLKAQAASDLKCSSDAVVTQGVGNYRERATCGGKQLLYYYDGESKQWVSPIDRAAYEISCPKEQLAAHVIDTKTVGISGCGHKVLYLLVTSHEIGPLGGVVEKYTWVMNTESSKKEAAPVATARATPESQESGTEPNAEAEE